ncbi:hypothetical protein ACLOJK_003236 [Asimina triloba]
MATENSNEAEQQQNTAKHLETLTIRHGYWENVGISNPDCKAAAIVAKAEEAASDAEGGHCIFFAEIQEHLPSRLKNEKHLDKENF